MYVYMPLGWALLYMLRVSAQATSPLNLLAKVGLLYT